MLGFINIIKSFFVAILTIVLFVGINLANASIAKVCSTGKPNHFKVSYNLDSVYRVDIQEYTNMKIISYNTTPTKGSVHITSIQLVVLDPSKNSILKTNLTHSLSKRINNDEVVLKPEDHAKN